MSDKEAVVAVKRKTSEEGESGGDATKKSRIAFNVGQKKPAADGTEKKSFSFSSSSSKPKMKLAPVTMKLGAAKPKEPEKKVIKPRGTAAKAFAEESDEEEEDMPPEAKMRMKNIGRNTPTSAGPNSFNKGKMGFCSPSSKWKTPRLKCDAEKPSVSEKEETS